MPAKKLTDQFIHGMKVEARQQELWDGLVSGLTLRASHHGTKTFYFNYRVNGRKRRFKLGRFGMLSLADARKAARLCALQVQQGQDPQTQRTDRKAKADDNIEKLVERFLAEHPGVSAKAHSERRRILTIEFVRRYGPAMPICDVDRIAVKEALKNIQRKSGPSAAIHALSAIRRFCNWCVEEELIEKSPCDGLKLPKHAERHRTLTTTEQRLLIAALYQIPDPFATIVLLLLLTGQRKTEVSSMRWQDIDFEKKEWTQPAFLTKSKRIHLVPVSDFTLGLLRRLPRIHDTYVFPARGKDAWVSGHNKWKRNLDSLCPMEPWTLHDLRRTFATELAATGISPHIIELILDHRPKELSGVAAIYNRHSYLKEQRNALDDWAAKIEAELGGHLFTAKRTELEVADGE